MAHPTWPPGDVTFRMSKGGRAGAPALFTAEGLASAAGLGWEGLGSSTLFPPPMHRFLTVSTRSWGGHCNSLGPSVPPTHLHRAQEKTLSNVVPGGPRDAPGDPQHTPYSANEAFNSMRIGK